MSLGSCGACMSVCVGVCWCVCVVVCVRGENGSQESTPRIDLRDSPHWFLSSPPICFLVRWINRHASCESCGSRREERGGSENCVVNEYVIIPFSLCTTNAAQSAPLCFISVRCFKRNWEFSRFHKKVLRRKCESQICFGGEAGLQPWYTTVGCSSCTRWRFTNQFFLIITRWILPVFESCFFYALSSLLLQHIDSSVRLRLSVLDNFVPRSSRRTPETCRTQTCCKLQGDGDQTRAEGKRVRDILTIWRTKTQLYIILLGVLLVRRQLLQLC